MQEGIHPEYSPVIFYDRSADRYFLTKSTLAAKAASLPTIDWEDGNTYPLVNVEVSSYSHPFYTGKNVVIDAAGQVQKVNARYGKKGTDMKVKASVRSLARKDGSYVVRRRGHLYVINKKNPHWKARQG